MGEFMGKGAGVTLGTLGTIGFGLSLLNGNNGCCGNGGILGNLLGGNCCNHNQQANAALAVMAEKDALISQLRAEKYSDKNTADVYSAMRNEVSGLSDRLLEKYINPIAKEIADMRVREQATTSAVDCLATNTNHRFDAVYKAIDCAKQECGAAIALESERRVNGDNSLMCFVQGTYVPGKLVMPASALCPEVMPRFNSYTTPTDTAPAVQPITGSVNVTNTRKA